MSSLREDAESLSKDGEDAESLSKDATSLALLESMRVVKASGDSEALARLMAQVKDSPS